MEYSFKKMTDVLNANGFKFSKKFGQNFIVDENIINNIINKSMIDKDTLVIEIGPGAGSLTYKLALNSKNVIAYEIDESLKDILNYNLSGLSNVEIIYGDFLLRDVKKDLEKYEYKKLYVVANLPYYITTPIIVKLIEDELNVDKIVVMVQKEAAERICAEPGTRKSGAISLAVRYFGKPEILFDVNKTCFMPVPAVDSSVIRIKLSGENRKEIKNKNSFFKIVKAAFSQRRKNILNSLSSGLKMPKNEVENLLVSAGVAQNLRAENLKLDDFVKLSNEIDLILK